MQIEPGEFFAVTRGERITASAFPTLTVFGFLPEYESPTEEPKFDRSFEGDIYLAMNVCGPLIAARRVFASRTRYMPETLSLNANDYELWPVTRGYAKSLGVNVDKEAAAFS